MLPQDREKYFSFRSFKNVYSFKGMWGFNGTSFGVMVLAGGYWKLRNRLNIWGELSQNKFPQSNKIL